MRSLAALVLALAVTPGCHAKFKKHVSSIDSVRTQTLQIAAPNVQLGYLHGGGGTPLEEMVKVGVNLGQTARSIKLTEELQGKVDTEAVAYAFHEGFAEAMEDGPPFGTTTAADAPLLQVEITDLGMEVATLGAPGVFDYDLRVRLYLPDGERVYSNSVHCRTGVGSPSPMAQALLVVNNAKALEEMPAEEVQAAFEGSARYCGMELTRQIRKHAS